MLMRLLGRADDMVAQAIKSSGGFVWACKNYDGDVQVRPSSFPNDLVRTGSKLIAPPPPPPNRATSSRKASVPSA
jgi:hypothetical protein